MGREDARSGTSGWCSSASMAGDSGGDLSEKHGGVAGLLAGGRQLLQDRQGECIERSELVDKYYCTTGMGVRLGQSPFSFYFFPSFDV